MFFFKLMHCFIYLYVVCANCFIDHVFYIIVSENIFGFHLHQNFSEPEDLSAYDGVSLRVKGDGRRYKLIIRTSSDWDTIGYTASFDTENGQWQTVSGLQYLLALYLSQAENVFS